MDPEDIPSDVSDDEVEEPQPKATDKQRSQNATFTALLVSLFLSEKANIADI
jgi:hypothetical protein